MAMKLHRLGCSFAEKDNYGKTPSDLVRRHSSKKDIVDAFHSLLSLDGGVEDIAERGGQRRRGKKAGKKRHHGAHASFSQQEHE